MVYEYGTMNAMCFVDGQTRRAVQFTELASPDDATAALALFDPLTHSGSLHAP